MCWYTFIRNWKITRFSKPVCSTLMRNTLSELLAEGYIEMLGNSLYRCVFQKAKQCDSIYRELPARFTPASNRKELGTPCGTFLLHLAYGCSWVRGHCHTTGPLLSPPLIHPAPGYFCAHEIKQKRACAFGKYQAFN